MAGTCSKIVVRFQTPERNSISFLYRLMEGCIRGKETDENVLEELKFFCSVFIIRQPERGDIVDTNSLDKLTHIDILPHRSYCFTIIVNAKNFKNMSEIIPFLLLQHEFEGLVSLGIDLGECDVRGQQNVLFKFSSFLLFMNDNAPICGYHSLYFINEKSEKQNKDSELPYYYFVSNSRTTALRYKSANSIINIDSAIAQASRYFQPLLRVDKALFVRLFQNAQIGESPEVSYILQSIKKLSSSIIKGFVPPRQGFSSLFEQWFFLAFYYSLPLDELKKINVIALNSTLHDYYIGIYELVQNIIFHTEEQQGWLYIMFCKKEDLSDEDRVIFKKDAASAVVNRYLKVGVYDFSRKGIPDTYCEDNHLDYIELSELIDPNVMPERRAFTEEVDFLSFTYAAHLGIKMLVSSVMCHNGWFCVESCQRGEKYVISGTSSSIDTQKKKYNVCGTHFEVVLPVTEFNHNDMFPIQSSSVADFLKAQLKSPLEIDAININECVNAKNLSNISSMDVQWKLIEDIADNIVSIINMSSLNNSFSSIGICALNMEGVQFPNPNQIFKLLACLQLKYQAVRTLILVNLPNSTVAHLCRIVKQVAHIKTNRHQPLWSRDHAVVLYGNSFGASIFCGESLPELSYVNNSMLRIYPGHTSYLAEMTDAKNDIQPNVLDQLVKPYECLIRVNGVPLFLQQTKSELDKPLGRPAGGYLIDDFRTKLGSKLYMERFFEADTMFQNGFFVDRFAFFIAKDLLSRLSFVKKSEIKPIIIVGCYSYSEPISRRVQFYITNLNDKKLYTVKQVITAIEVEDENNMAFHWQDMQTESLSKFNESYIYVLIAPISATLSSHDKTISLFKKNTGNFTISFPFQYSVLLIRDSEQPESATAIEKEWNLTDVSNGIATTAYNNTKEVRFLIEKGSHWHNLLDKETFPEHFQDEIFLNRTKNASLNTKDYFGFPIAALPNKKDMVQELSLVMSDKKLTDVWEDYYTLICKRLAEFDNNIQIGHIEHHDNHHRYYFNTEGYVNREKNGEFSKWLSYQKYKFGKVASSKISYVIITPDVNKESCFVDRINEVVFESNALVIHLDVYSSAQNISYKYAFLQHLPSDSKFFFIDHAMLTGETFYRTLQLMSFVNEKFIFYGIITVVNRLSLSLYTQINADVGKYGIESYLWFSILPSQNTYSDCSLCGLERYYDYLRKCTVCRDVKSHCDYNKRKFLLSHLKYYKPQFGDEPSVIETAGIPRRKQRMLARNNLFYHISLLANEVGSENEKMSVMAPQIIADKVKIYLQKEYKTIGNEIDDKISFLKAISFPPLSQYVHIREFAYKTNLNELSIVLGKNAPDYNDFCLLKAILKNLAYLSSNALVRKNVIMDSWYLCRKVLNDVKEELTKLHDENDTYQRSKRLKLDKKHESADLFDAQHKEHYEKLEVQKQQLEKFKVSLLFYIKCAIHNDESKSFFLGELMRTGKEPDMSRPLEVHASVETTFCGFPEKDVDFSDFLDWLYYDNNTIMRKTLSNFGKEIDKNTNGLYHLFKTEDGNLLSLEEFKKNVNVIVESLIEIVKDNYYYTWFRMYLSEDSINKGKLIDYDKDGVPLIRIFVYLLYAKILFEKIEYGKGHDYINDVKTLLNLSLMVMDATDAFIVINHNSIGRKRILAYCGNHEINEFSEASYLDLIGKLSNNNVHSPFLIVEEEDFFSGLHVTNYKKGCFLPLFVETSNPVARKQVGVVSFLYDGESPKFRIRKRECARLLMLLGEELDKYNAHCKSEKLFEIWYDQEETRRKYRKTNFTSNHRLQLGDWDFESLDTISYVKIYQGLFMMSNVVVSHLYSVISEEKKLNFTKKHISILDIFSDSYVALLNKLNSERWDGTLLPINLENVNFNMSCSVVIMQSLIIQCLENSYGKYADRSKRISISFGSSSFTITNTIVNVDKERLIQDERRFKKLYNPDVLWKNRNLGRLSNYGMTLVSMFFYCDSVGMKCKWDFNTTCSPFFKVEVTI